MKLLPTISTAFLAAGLLFSLNAQSVTTDPVGYVTVNLAGENVGVISQGLHQPVEFMATPASVAGSIITFADVDLVSLLDNGPYGIDFQGLSGNGYVLPITAIDEATLTISEDISSEIDSSVSVAVRRLLTIADIFGTGDSLMLQAGTPLTADRIQMRNPLSEGNIQLFYSSGGLLGVGWRRVGGGNTNASDTLVVPGEGLRVIKKSSGDLEFTFVGSVRSKPLSLSFSQGVSPLATSFPVGTTLGNSGLFNSEDPSNSLASGTPLTADRILVDGDNDGRVETYFYSSGGLLGVGWRRVGSGNTDMSSIPIDNGFVIIKRSEGTINVSMSSPILD